MSSAEDYIDDYYLSDEIWCSWYDDPADDLLEGIWTTADGRRMPISNMSESHINNSIRMLQRGEAPHLNGWISRFTDHLKNNPPFEAQ